MMNSRRFVSIIVALAAVVCLSGCGGQVGSDDDGDEMVLHHALGTKIQGLDSGNMRDVYSMMVGSQIMETLFQYHFLKRPYELEPLLAESMPEISEDRIQYRIKIKKGVYFQDDKCFPDGKGRELKTEDFAYAIKRIANVKYVSQNWSIFDDRIVGLNEFREYTKTCKTGEEVDFSRPVEGLECPDDYTLIIKLNRPWPQMLATALADTASAPMAKEAVDFYGKDIINHPVGTGPYRLKEWRKGSYIELVRNPRFRSETYPTEGEPGDLEAGYLDDAGKPVPFADKIIWKVILESQPRWFLLLQGQLDAMGIPKDNYDEAIAQSGELTPEMKARHIQLKTFVDPSTFWVGFNMLDPVLGKNKPLRQAISRSINREKFIELFSNGRDVIAHGFVAPLMDSYDPSIKDEGYSRYDPAEAKSLLKEAEKAAGGAIGVLKISMPGTDTFSRQYGQFLTGNLTAVGLEVDVEYMDWPTYLEKINNRSAQIFCSGVSASIPDAEDFLGMFCSKYWAPGSNRFNYKNEEYDRLYEQVSVMPESPERIELYQKMERMVMEDCPAAFLNHRVAYVLNHEWYKNDKPHVFSYGVSKYRRIDLEKRRAYKDLLKTIK